MNNVVIGKKDTGRKLTNLTAGDPWAESPFYGPGAEGSEHVNPWPVGGVIAGVYMGSFMSNKSGPETKQREYAKFKTVDGELFRVFTPGQLTWLLSKLNVGTYCEITYLGKEFAEKLNREVHKFDLSAENPAMN